MSLYVQSFLKMDFSFLRLQKKYRRTCYKFIREEKRVSVHTYPLYKIAIENHGLRPSSLDILDASRDNL